MRRSPGASVRIGAVYSTNATDWYLDPAGPIPLRHRIMWSPITALLCFAGMIAADIVLGLTTARILGLGVGVVWLGLALHNRRTNNAFLRSIYAPSMHEDVPTARVVEPVERPKS
ncbi:MAG: hypothetical protein ACKV2T_02445 [Kofleriaceae bacterium]